MQQDICPRHEHLSRRSMLKGSLTTAAGGSLMNWGGLFNSDAMAAEVKKKSKRWRRFSMDRVCSFQCCPLTPVPRPSIHNIVIGWEKLCPKCSLP